MEEINKQVKELRDIAEDLYKHAPYSLKPVLHKAADTIESLYQKQLPKEIECLPDCGECEKYPNCPAGCKSYLKMKIVFVCPNCRNKR